jgi:hypothetical protein
MARQPQAALTVATIAETGGDAKPVSVAGAESIYAARLKFNSWFARAGVCE